MKGLTIAVSGLHRGDNPQPGPAVIRSIRREFPGVNIVGLAYDLLESGLFSTDTDSADVTYMIPFPTKGPAALLERLDDIRDQITLDMIIPCLDSEIDNYQQLTTELKYRGIKVPRVTPKMFDQRSKENLPRLAKSVGIRTPKTIVVTDLKDVQDACDEIGFPLFIKGKQYGAAKVTSLAEAEHAFHSLILTWGGPVILQAAVNGSDEYDVVGLGDGKGGLIGSCSIRKLMLTPTGKAFGGIVVDDPVLNEHVENIIRKLKWWGPFELEFVKSKHGHELIEMNPRFPAWVDFPSQIGCNLPAALAGMLWYDLPTPMINKCEAGKMFMRHCIDIAGDITQIAELSSGSTNVRELVNASA